MLRLDHIQAGYGDQPVISQLEIEVERGEVVSLIGANGAGKTTTLRSVVGLATMTAGRVRVEEREFAAPKATQMLAAGVALVPEGRGILAGL